MGFSFWHAKGGETRARVSGKSYESLKDKIRKLTSRNWPVSMASRVLGREIDTNDTGLGELLRQSGCPRATRKD